MKSYSGRKLTREEMLANCRISRARQVVENAFSEFCCRRCSSCQRRYRPFLKLVCLHNFISERNPVIQDVQLDDEDGAHNLIPGAWRQDANLPDLDVPPGRNRDTNLGRRQRDYLKEYFNSPAGLVPWQDRMVDT